MKAIVCLAAVAGMASVAMGDLVSNQIDVRVRVFGTNDPWSNALTLQSANLVDPIVVEVGVFYYRNQGYGFAAGIHSVVGAPYSSAKGDLATILDNPNSVQHPDGRVGNGAISGAGWNWGGQHQVVYHTGTAGVDANRFRIADRGNPTDLTAGGISIAQRAPTEVGAGFVTEDGFLGYHFKLSLACYDGGAARAVVINAPDNRINSYRAWLTNSSAPPTNIGGTRVGGQWSDILPSDPATVNVSWVPAPASAGVLGLGGLVGWRRRRR